MKQFAYDTVIYSAICVPISALLTILCAEAGIYTNTFGMWVIYMSFTLFLGGALAILRRPKQKVIRLNTYIKDSAGHELHIGDTVRKTRNGLYKTER